MLAKLGIFAFILLNGSLFNGNQFNGNSGCNRLRLRTNTHTITKKYKNSTNSLPRNIRKLQTYVEENVLTSFTLYTIINECRRAIIIYHNKYTEYHGNTTLVNFKLENDLQDIYLDGPINKNLTASNN
jgi:hypothetical protein